jgi:hypothetical protein
MPSRIHCTILARNYLPSALVLGDSLRRHRTENPLVVFLTDATPETELPEIEGVRWMYPASLDLPGRTVLELAMSYDLVEFATALKPLVLMALLRDHEEVVYLDPDTYLVSEMVELGPALAGQAPIVLTPHFLTPPPPGNQFSEGHLLHVGVYNLGFCAVNRRADDLLRWWWDHLRSDCLHDPLSGLFVDQKWMDVGSVLFGAEVLRHYGYNVGAGNVHERPLARDSDGYYIASSGDRLRLFHFHAFDPRRPESLYNRLRTRDGSVRADGEALLSLCAEYAAAVLARRQLLGPQPAYRYASDTTGRRITRRMRHAYRVAAQADPGRMPSPFVAEEAADYERWRRGAAALAGRLTLSDVAKGLRCAMPEEYDNVATWRTPASGAERSSRVKRFPGPLGACRGERGAHLPRHPLPRELTRIRPAGGKLLFGHPERLLDPRAQTLRAVVRDHHRVAARHLQQSRVGRDHERQSQPQRLNRGQPEALEVGWKQDRGRSGEDRLELLVCQPGQQLHALGDPELGCESLRRCAPLGGQPADAQQQTAAAVGVHMQPPGAQHAVHVLVREVPERQRVRPPVVA